MSKPGYLYILASGPRGTLYVGVTSRLTQRTWEHSTGVTEGFTRRYRVDRLVYFEVYDDIREAILREKRIKAWKRLWKIELIESRNPDWRDLSRELWGGEEVRETQGE